VLIHVGKIKLFLGFLFIVLNYLVLLLSVF
jgi:hypothetical protein